MEIKLNSVELSALMVMLANEQEKQHMDWRERLLIKLTEAYAKM